MLNHSSTPAPNYPMTATTPLGYHAALMHLVYSELVATYRVVRALRLPHHSGSLLRGILGRALRSSGCAAATPCAAACEAPTACTYARLFDPPLPDPLPHKLLRGATMAPQPLLPIIPAPGAIDLHEDEVFSFAVRVLGRLASADEQRLCRALEAVAEAELGRSDGQLAVVSVTRRGELDRAPSIPSFDPAPQRATITFETPAWIEHRKVLPTEPDFRTLFRNFNRRLTIMSALYGERSAADDERFAELDARCDAISVRAELRPLSWERHSIERDQRHPMKGLIGTVELEGPLEPFVETLRLAELVHVGKATSHGLGRIRVAFC